MLSQPMLNRSYQMRAVREAGGGHAVAEAFYRPKKLVRPGVAAVRCKKGGKRRLQLELAFPEPALPESGLLEFPPLAGVEIPILEEERTSPFWVTLRPVTAADPITDDDVPF